MLRAQLDPHMLFNTLANLRALIATDPPRAQRMIDHLVPFLRATLDGSREDVWSLRQEFEELGHYLEIMAIRLGPRLEFETSLPRSVPPLDVPAPAAAAARGERRAARDRALPVRWTDRREGGAFGERGHRHGPGPHRRARCPRRGVETARRPRPDTGRPLRARQRSRTAAPVSRGPGVAVVRHAVATTPRGSS